MANKPKDKSQRVVISAGEFSKLIGSSKQHVLNLIDCGKLGAINIGTGMAKFWRIPVTERDKFLRRQELP